nr:hypothetical protein [Sphingopyxis sp. PET50]
MAVHFDEQPQRTVERRIACSLPAQAEHLHRRHFAFGERLRPPPVIALDFLDHRDEQPFLGSEMIAEQPVAGTKLLGKLAQREVGDPVRAKIGERGGEHPLPGFRTRPLHHFRKL